MKIISNQKFNNRQEISELLGGDTIKGITQSSKTKTVLLFMNAQELYFDKLYVKDEKEYCLFTGIGRVGHQDSITNNAYDLNMAVLTHNQNKRHLLLFEKQGYYCFKGEFELFETYQNEQLDDNQELRRVFVFHLKKVSDNFIFN